MHLGFKSLNLCTYYSNCDRVCIFYVESIVSRKSKRTGYQIFFIVLYIYTYLICETEINL